MKNIEGAGPVALTVAVFLFRGLYLLGEKQDISVLKILGEKSFFPVTLMMCAAIASLVYIFICKKFAK